MRNLRKSSSSLIVLASVFLAALIMIACNQTKETTPAAQPATQTAQTTEKVFVVFEGPWAFAPDPKDAGSVVAIAPKTKGHRDLDVKASNDSILASGAYDLSLPARSGPANATVDPDILQAKIDAHSLQRALDAKSGRYSIRLPKPEAYVVAYRSRSRVDTKYPPDPSTEKQYATAVSLRYTVSTLTGFSLAGTPDSGVFNPLLLQVETPTVRFVIEPAEYDDPADKCDTHSRESFRDLTKLLSLTLYVDFPNNPDECHKKDPQYRPTKAALMPPLDRMLASASGSWSLASAQTASVADGALLASGDGRFRAVAVKAISAAMYFFGASTRDCRAPVVILTPSP